MVPLAAAGLISGGSALLKALIAANQNRKANQIAANRPTYRIPGEIINNQKMYQSLAGSSRLPGASTLENNLGASTAGSINAAMQAGGSGSDILAAISGLNQNQNNSLNNLAVQGAEFQAMNMDKLAQANSQLAEYRDQEFDYNKNQPYELALARKRALEGAAFGNLESALSDVSGFGTAMALNGGPVINKNPSSGVNAAWGSSAGKSPLVGLRTGQFTKPYFSR